MAQQCLMSQLTNEYEFSELVEFTSTLVTGKFSVVLHRESGNYADVSIHTFFLLLHFCNKPAWNLLFVVQSALPILYSLARKAIFLLRQTPKLVDLLGNASVFSQHHALGKDDTGLVPRFQQDFSQSEKSQQLLKQEQLLSSFAITKK